MEIQKFHCVKAARPRLDDVWSIRGENRKMNRRTRKVSSFFKEKRCVLIAAIYFTATLIMLINCYIDFLQFPFSLNFSINYFTQRGQSETDNFARPSSIFRLCPPSIVIRVWTSDSHVRSTTNGQKFWGGSHWTGTTAEKMDFNGAIISTADRARVER